MPTATEKQALINARNEELERFRRMEANLQMNLATAEIAAKLRKNLQGIRERLAFADGETGFRTGFGWDTSREAMQARLEELHADIQEYNAFQISELAKESSALLEDIRQKRGNERNNRNK